MAADEAAAADLAAAAPGAALAARLERMDPAAVGDDELVEVICACERLVAWGQAAQARAIAVFATRRPPLGRDDRGVGVSEYAADELSVALRLSRPAAGTRLHTAIEVCDRLPGTLTAWSAGAVDGLKARSIADATRPLTPVQAGLVEHRVLPRAPAQTVGQLRAALARAVAAADPHGAAHRHEQAYADRRVVLTPADHGMAELWAYLRAADATALYHRLTSIARAPDPDTGPDPGSGGDRTRDRTGRRSMDARRADALTGLAHTADGTGRPAPALIQITVAAGTLLGLDEQPADLAGYGPITAGEARRLAADGRWRRLLTDPATGTLLDHGRRTYPPPAALADHIRARDHTCRFPTCRQPAATADLDHTTPYPAGPTTEANLAALCRHHHRLKHHAGWTLTQDAGATLTWTTPTGHRHLTTPPALAESTTETGCATDAADTGSATATATAEGAAAAANVPDMPPTAENDLALLPDDGNTERGADP